MAQTLTPCRFAAVPLGKGDNKSHFQQALCPPYQEGQPRSGRGSGFEPLLPRAASRARKDDVEVRLEYDAPMSTTETVPKKLFTRDEFQRILDAGIFPTDKRYELIRGEIIEMPPIAGAHAGRVNFLTRLFTSRLGESVIVSIQNPMAIDD